MAHVGLGLLSVSGDQRPSSWFRGTLLGTPNREPQEYSRNIRGIYLPGSLYSIVFLLYITRNKISSHLPTCMLGRTRSTGKCIFTGQASR